MYNFVTTSALAALLLASCSADVGSPVSTQPELGALTDSTAAPKAKKKTVIEPKNGPFGLEMGMSLDDVKLIFGKAAIHESPRFLVFDTAPVPYRAIDQYSVVVGPIAGLCKVTGTAEVESNSYGHQVTESVTQIVDALTEKYGPPTDKLDFVLNGSLWKEPRYFMMGLLQKDRTLMHLWNGEKTELPASLGAISVSASGESSDTAQVRLSYEFTNMDACIEEDRKASNAGL